MSLSRIHRALSAFKPGTQRWAAIPLKSPFPSHPPNQTLSLVSWNLDAFHSRPVARSALILDHILRSNPPDILFFQELTSAVRTSLLADLRIRSGFLTTDAEDTTSFDDLPFSTMTLLSNKRFFSHPHPQPLAKLIPQAVFRIPLPSKYNRDALCIDIASESGSILRLINVHLDS